MIYSMFVICIQGIYMHGHEQIRVPVTDGGVSMKSNPFKIASKVELSVYGNFDCG